MIPPGIVLRLPPKRRLLWPFGFHSNLVCCVLNQSWHVRLLLPQAGPHSAPRQPHRLTVHMALNTNLHRIFSRSFDVSARIHHRTLTMRHFLWECSHQRTWREHITSWGLEMWGWPARWASRHQITGTTCLLSACGVSPNAWPMLKSAQRSWRIWGTLEWRRTSGFFAIAMADPDILFK